MLNALVMPGLGQLAAGRKAKGSIIVALTLVFLCYPVFRFTLALYTALEKIPIQAGATVRTIHALAMAWSSEAGVILWCLLAIAVLWVYGIVDLYLLKRKLLRSAGGKP
ncbi:MAG TPA: hypothetical protein PLY45_02040 [bacterium]|nr:hypothetical protein [bacterium]